MTDIHSKDVRSYNMSKIRSKNTKPELLVRRFLFSRGFRYRLHDRRLPRKPDVVLPKYKTVIFVNGCFWHGHENCRYAPVSKTRIEFWDAKIKRNQMKDIEATNELQVLGWNIITVWECELKPKCANQTLNSLLKTLKNILPTNSHDL